MKTFVFSWFVPAVVLVGTLGGGPQEPPKPKISVFHTIVPVSQSA